MIRFWFLMILSFLSIDMSKSSGGCQDYNSICPSLSHLCFLPEIAYNCEITCDQCPVKDCLYCVQICIPPTEIQNLPTCDCFPGYFGNNCEDINECESQGGNPCEDGKKCLNTPGSYFCSNCDLTDEQGIWSYYGERQGCCDLNPASLCGKSSSNQTDETVSDPLVAGIVGGVDAPVARWPWQAILGLVDDNLSAFSCGGSLISSTYVLSAAHCLTDIPMDQVFVLFGVTNLTAIINLHAQTQNIAQVYIHEDYNPPSDDNDIALIRLSQPVTISEFVRPICLPGLESPEVGEICYASGFGYITSDGDDTSILQEVALPIVSDEQCTEDLSGANNEELNICAGLPEGGRDTCQGDSGGPLMCQRCNSCDWYLAGITSFGFGCGDPGSPGVYVEVSAYQDWIEERTGEVIPKDDNECARPDPPNEEDCREAY